MPPLRSRLTIKPFIALHGVILGFVVVGCLLMVAVGSRRVRAQEPPDTLQPISSPGAVAPAAVEAARSAVVRVEVAGAYRLPYTTSNRVQAATGSGFLIQGTDAAGDTIVTNAHVAIRGAELNIYRDGSVEPLSARVLGISECADIAVLQLTDASFPGLDWRRAEIAPSDPVFAAGYPGGAFDLVITAGTVKAVEADDETEWASVETVLNHTAATDPGSSGGPLLDAAGDVAGIVFAESGNYADRNYAIAADISTALVESLRSGDSAESIGVTAEALPRDAALPGVWVIAVEADSPAALAGLLPGDIIRTLNRKGVGRDGTLSSYCRILREQGGSRFAIEVYRPDTGQVLSGELNGARLVASRRFDIALVPTATPPPLPTPLPTPVPGDLHDVSDETGLLTLQVPTGWTYSASSPQRVGTVVFSPSMVVAADERSFLAGRAAFVRAWALQKGASAAKFSADFFSEASNIANCTPIVTTLEDGVWSGKIHSFGHCPGFEGAQFLAAILTPADDDSVTVYIDQLLPADTSHFSLETLLAPLAGSLLPRIPFWEPPRAKVLVEGLNVRSGPGLDSAIVTTLHNGESLPVLGKDGPACEWIYFYYTNLDGWSSAATQYMQLDRPCSSIAVITPEEIVAFKSEQ